MSDTYQTSYEATSCCHHNKEKSCIGDSSGLLGDRRGILFHPPPPPPPPPLSSCDLCVCKHFTAYSECIALSLCNRTPFYLGSLSLSLSLLLPLNPIFNLVSTYEICNKRRPKVMFGAIHPLLARRRGIHTVRLRNRALSCLASASQTEDNFLKNIR